MRIIKKALRKIFTTAGYELKKLPLQLNKIESKHRSSDKIVELIGATGVGKSTLFRNLQDDLRNDWFFKSQLKVEITKSRDHFNLLGIDEQVFIDLLLQEKYKNLNDFKDMNLAKKTSLYIFFIREMEMDVFARYTPLSKGLFSGDGLTHNFKHEILFLKNINDSLTNFKKECLRNIFKNRSIIHLDASTEYIINNLKKRSIEDHGSGNDWYSYYGQEGITQFVKDAQCNEKKIADIAQYYGSELLYLNAEEPLSIKKELIFNFLDKILE
jgi:hypothetical protein